MQCWVLLQQRSRCTTSNFKLNAGASGVCRGSERSVHWWWGWDGGVGAGGVGGVVVVAVVETPRFRSMSARGRLAGVRRCAAVIIRRRDCEKNGDGTRTAGAMTARMAKSSSISRGKFPSRPPGNLLITTEQRHSLARTLRRSRQPGASDRAHCTQVIAGMPVG
jgi:hypothetical protein